MSLKSELLKFLSGMSNTQTVRERKALLASVGFDRLGRQITWEGSNPVFFNDFLDLLRSEGQTSLVSFLRSLADSDWIGLEDRLKLSVLIERVQVLTTEQWTRAFWGTAEVVPEHTSEISDRTSINTRVTKILILAANPKETTALRLDSEIKTLEEKLGRSQMHEQLKLASEWVIRPKDLYQTVRDYKPRIIHFTGYGTDGGGLALENESGQIQIIGSEVLAGLFKLLSEQVECVLLRSCYSEAQANAILEHINFLVSIKQEVNDDTVIKFITTFYEALGCGETIKSSYNLGCEAIKAAELPEYLIPALEERASSNLDTINNLVQDIREKIYTSIKERCGTMRVLDMTQPVGLSDIYTDVNILEKLTGRRRLDVADLLQACNPGNFDRLGLGGITENRLPGLDAVEQYSKLMVLGKPGAGKTTFLKYLAIQCNEGKFHAYRIPVFVTLKSFAEARNQPELIDYISRQFEDLDVERSKVIGFLNHGRALILLDGLDEVKEEHGSRILRQIHEFSERFYKNNFVITCRIAAKEYIFEAFTEVEVADFDEKQISSFSSKWFRSKDPKKSKRFIQKLKENEPIQELGTNPLLLTLLCLVFEETADFPKNRSELYKEGLDVLLKKWDAKRDIEREQIYKKLSLKNKEDLLSQIALTTFENGDYFIRQRQLELHISDYIQNLPDVQNSTEAIQIDSEMVLKSIEAQHGLLVERARGIYSFSHLTFHEYFTAREITLNFDPQISLQKLASHIMEPRWREVFLLTAGMLRQADRLLLLMKQEIDKLLVPEKRLLQFLSWVNHKALSEKTHYKLSAVRSFYFDLARVRAHAQKQSRNVDSDDMTRDFGLTLSRARVLDPSFDLSRFRTLKLDFTLTLAYAIATDLKFVARNFIDELEEDYEDEGDEDEDYEDERDEDEDEDDELYDDELENEDLNNNYDDSLEDEYYDNDELVENSSPENNNDIDGENYNDESEEEMLDNEFEDPDSYLEDTDLYLYDDFETAPETSGFNILSGFLNSNKPLNSTEDFSTKVETFDQVFNYAVKLASSYPSNIGSSLELLRKKLPLVNKQKFLIAWWRSWGGSWIIELSKVMVESRDIGHNWQFNRRQEQLLNQYYSAHQLLIDVLNNGCYVTRATREEIEKSLLSCDASI